VKPYGFAPLPGVFDHTRGRRELQELSGKRCVPALALDGGAVVEDSHAIVEWARADPA
jgi:glutathione S-transferase